MTVASNVKQCLATLKGVEAQLSSLALNSLEEEARIVFHESTMLIGNIKKDLQYRVLELERQEPQYSGS
ncbi:DUF1657 domain-containing protein [Bacillus sp. BRMEA1]|uniref:DUF1657 domain-containing protein n=1 Tax=Neobacillus endophyticus TaxID=2738405 RepID=UPI001564FFE8|nr:DUF1657 domain-containing protein [Neobacillus endophyticus]NRD80370.1 DUF1657 domain-containing protein [Neobacillus endophyticus]